MRIENHYDEQIGIISSQPVDENALVELRNTIAEIDVNLAKMATEVDQIYSFMLILEDYCYVFDEANVEKFWKLKQKPSDMKMAVLTGRKAAEK